MKDNFFKGRKILVTGGAGFLGQRVVSALIKNGALKKNISTPRSKEYDLRVAQNCEKVTKGKDIVIHCAATVGGIAFNKKHPAQTFYDNSIMGINLLHAAYKSGVKKFVMVGSVCEYPKFTPVPFKESDLWAGYPEESNGAYGVAKKTVLVQGQAYREEYGFNAIHLLLENLYGPNDNFDPKSSHVIPALIRKINLAKKEKEPLVVWGSGKATREFLYVDDAADAIILATQGYNQAEPINIGSGLEISIKNLVKHICKLMDFEGKIVWDKTKPDGQLRRAIDCTKARKLFKFQARTGITDGLKQTINWYNKNLA